MNVQENTILAQATEKEISPLVLLAEDDADDQELIIYAFSLVGTKHKLYTVSNGREVVEYLSTLDEKELPCLIVLDYNMPELNGAEVLQLLSQHKKYQQLPKIVFSTSDSPKYKEHCLALGAHDYLVKPSSIDGIKEAVLKMLSYCG